MIRNGQQHIESLRDGRSIFLDGEKIADATSHPAYRARSRRSAACTIFSAGPENRELMTYDTGDGSRANRIWQLPGSYEELKARRRGLEAWAELHAGFLGRAPDHVASCISGMYMGLDVFEAYDSDRRQGTRRLLPLRARQRSLSHLRHHQSAGGPLQEREPAEGHVPQRRRGRPRRRGHHGPRRQDAGDRRRSWPTRCSSPPSSRCSRATRSTRSRS